MTPADLAALGVRVKPLVWSTPNGVGAVGVLTFRVWQLRTSSGKWIHSPMQGAVRFDTRAEAMAACEAHHVAAVLAMIELVE